MISKNVYVASSWKAAFHDELLAILRGAGYGAFDYREAGPSGAGFSWGELDEGWSEWSLAEYVAMLDSGRANEAFSADLQGLHSSDTLILLMPSGISSHLEYGYAAGLGKKVAIYYPHESLKPQIDLMVKVGSVIIGLPALLRWLRT